MGFVIAALVLLVFSVGFVTMTPYVPEAGAFFSYVTVGLGERVGKGIAVVALIAYTAIQVGIYGYIGWAINDTVTHYNGPVIPWPVYSFVVLAIVAVLGYRHIELSAKVLGVALALEIGIVVILDVVMVANPPSPAGVTLSSFDPAVFTHGTLALQSCSRLPDSSVSRPPPYSATRRGIRNAPSARHLRRGHHHRRVLRDHGVGVRRRSRARPGDRDS